MARALAHAEHDPEHFSAPPPTPSMLQSDIRDSSQRAVADRRENERLQRRAAQAQRDNEGLISMHVARQVRDLRQKRAASLAQRSRGNRRVQKGRVSTISRKQQIGGTAHPTQTVLDLFNNADSRTDPPPSLTDKKQYDDDFMEAMHRFVQKVNTAIQNTFVSFVDFHELYEKQKIAFGAGYSEKSRGMIIKSSPKKEKAATQKKITLFLSKLGTHRQQLTKKSELFNQAYYYVYHVITNDAAPLKKYFTRLTALNNVDQTLTSAERKLNITMITYTKIFGKEAVLSRQGQLTDNQKLIATLHKQILKKQETSNSLLNTIRDLESSLQTIKDGVTIGIRNNKIVLLQPAGDVESSFEELIDWMNSAPMKELLEQLNGFDTALEDFMQSGGRFGQRGGAATSQLLATAPVVVGVPQEQAQAGVVMGVPVPAAQEQQDWDLPPAAPVVVGVPQEQAQAVPVPAAQGQRDWDLPPAQFLPEAEEAEMPVVGAPQVQEQEQPQEQLQEQPQEQLQEQPQEQPQEQGPSEDAGGMVDEDTGGMVDEDTDSVDTGSSNSERLQLIQLATTLLKKIRRIMSALKKENTGNANDKTEQTMAAPQAEDAGSTYSDAGSTYSDAGSTPPGEQPPLGLLIASSSQRHPLPVQGSDADLRELEAGMTEEQPPPVQPSFAEREHPEDRDIRQHPFLAHGHGIT